MPTSQPKKIFITLAIVIFAMTSAAAQDEWTEMPLPQKYFGIWKVNSRTSSRNDVTISGQYIVDGSFSMQIVKGYYNNGTYKVITTANGYFQSHFIKDRVGGLGNGGISINDIGRQLYTSMEEALKCPIPNQLDSGYR
jgi:hypothetical protein